MGAGQRVERVERRPRLGSTALLHAPGRARLAVPAAGDVRAGADGDGNGRRDADGPAGGLPLRYADSLPDTDGDADAPGRGAGADAAARAAAGSAADAPAVADALDDVQPRIRAGSLGGHGLGSRAGPGARRPAPASDGRPRPPRRAAVESRRPRRAGARAVPGASRSVRQGSVGATRHRRHRPKGVALAAGAAAAPAEAAAGARQGRACPAHLLALAPHLRQLSHLQARHAHRDARDDDRRLPRKRGRAALSRAGLARHAGAAQRAVQGRLNQSGG
mmetsp:Transcript_24939/g.80595  ORF Transcript_24939/g.80595 Transcript_24939/m.80595 type:complete len:277 (+) Transcript_24939:712-1542(+)